ncbi:hypothetical protein N657DRAFT_448031 [Parathielavia appendiculata]|uniref:Uncharacterized protein n=1 Tax=Parathielavia appendiculata TaxID=2587402 RepID=A0AAN6Z2F5_9PEZI|nr:hypothetical protein N657DRAFT_448031 [Parathielavia appendiculata]
MATHKPMPPATTHPPTHGSRSPMTKLCPVLVFPLLLTPKTCTGRSLQPAPISRGRLTSHMSRPSRRLILGSSPSRTHLIIHTSTPLCRLRISQKRTGPAILGRAPRSMRPP